MNVCPSLSLQKTGWSSLFFAAEKGDVDTTNLLLKAGANALLKDKVSSIQGSVWCVAVLYCVSFSPEQCNCTGCGQSPWPRGGV